jgi:hypothetical protein
VVDAAVFDGEGLVRIRGLRRRGRCVGGEVGGDALLGWGAVVVGRRLRRGASWVRVRVSEDEEDNEAGSFAALRMTILGGGGDNSWWG